MAYRAPFKPVHKSPLGDFASQVDLGGSALSNPPRAAAFDTNPFRGGFEAPRAPTRTELETANYLNIGKLEVIRAKSVVEGVVVDSATEKVTALAIGKTAASLVGVAAIPFAAADLFDFLAPGVKAWLQGGWKGAQGQGLPGTYQDGPFPLGGTPGASYELIYRLYRNYQLWVGYGYIYFTGPLIDIVVPSAENGYYPYLRVLAGDPAVYTNANESLNTNFNPLFTYEIYSLTRTDGQTDPPTLSVDTRPSHVSNPRPAETSQIPSPGHSPLTGNLPSTQALSDISPDPDSRRTVVPDFSGGTQSGELSNPNHSGKTPAPSLAPVPKDYPATSPRNPVGTLSADDGCSPCAIKTGAKLDEISEKLDDLLEDKPEPECADCPEYRFDYVRVTCEDGRLALTPARLYLTSPPSQALRDEFDALAKLAAEGCGKDPVAAIPDWWQVRIGAERPQIVVTYRKEGTGTYHQISVPHPAATEKWASNLLGDYRKGPYAAILTLTDNSKFIVNCESEGEARRMLAIAKTLISPAYQGDGVTEQVTKRSGRAVEPANLIGRTASYFPTGQKKTIPLWRAQFGQIHRLP
jgi:hypothetical protein